MTTTAILAGAMFAGNTLMQLSAVPNPAVTPGMVIIVPAAAHAFAASETVMQVDGARLILSGPAMQDLPAGTIVSLSAGNTLAAPFAASTMMARRNTVAQVHR